jgi:hypothetical protein
MDRTYARVVGQSGCGLFCDILDVLLGVLVVLPIGQMKDFLSVTGQFFNSIVIDCHIHQ